MVSLEGGVEVGDVVGDGDDLAFLEVVDGARGVSADAVEDGDFVA